MSWYVYVIQSVIDDSLYTGIAKDVGQRLAEHNAGTGAKRTRGRGPWVLLAAREVSDRSEATRLELSLKRLSRQKKLAWCKNHRTGVCNGSSSRSKCSGASGE